MFQERTFCHFWLADTVNRQSGQSNNVIKQMKARASCRQRDSEQWGIVQLVIQNEASGGETTRNSLLKQ
jgi:hypothetical protein